MPTPLQYPLERCRALQERWLRPWDHQPPPDRDDDDDEDDDEEDEEEAEPAVIREPDEDE